MRATHPLVVLIGVRRSKERSAGHDPRLWSNDLGRERAGTKQWVQVLIDQAREDHRCGERVVNRVRPFAERCNDIIERTDSNDPTVGNGNGVGSGLVRVHRDDGSGDMDDNTAGFGHVRNVGRPDAAWQSRRRLVWAYGLNVTGEGGP